jgi:transposase
MIIKKTNHNDAISFVQSMPTVWCIDSRIKSVPDHLTQLRSVSRGLLVEIRCDVDNRIRGVLKISGGFFDKVLLGLIKLTAKIVVGDLIGSADLAHVMEILSATRNDICRTFELDVGVMKSAKSVGDSDGAGLDQNTRMKKPPDPP